MEGFCKDSNHSVTFVTSEHTSDGIAWDLNQHKLNKNLISQKGQPAFFFFLLLVFAPLKCAARQNPCFFPILESHTASKLSREKQEYIMHD